MAVKKRVAIVQSNYIPWKGYFDLIDDVDEFVLYDDVQYTRRDWRNRNIIKSKDGLRWLTIPVSVKGKYHQTIAETEISEDGWRETHLSALRHSYARAPYFGEYITWLTETYEACTSPRLTDVNELWIRRICRLLGIETAIRRSSEFKLVPGKNERLIQICLQTQATEYVSGPSAAAYLDLQMFAHSDIAVSYKQYGPYPPYEQLFAPYEDHVTVLDVIFHTGSAARHYVTGR